jgi:thiamine pyrophosphokinase
MAGYDPPVTTLDDGSPDRRRHDRRLRHAVVVADGDVPSRDALDAAWPGWADAVELVIAADGGLVRARTIGLEPTLLVGDLDSIEPAVLATAEATGLPIHRSPADKDESDAELALLEALDAGADRVTILGAFGGSRVDHELANLWLLAHPAARDARVELLDARARATMIVAPGDGTTVTIPLAGPVGGTVSLLPFGGDALGITTHGLRYPLRDEPLVTGPARGLSNVRVTPDASVALRGGRLLVIETAT